MTIALISTQSHSQTARTRLATIPDMSTLASGHDGGRPGHVGRLAGGERARRTADAATPAFKDASQHDPQNSP